MMRCCVVVGGADINNYDFIRKRLHTDDYVMFCDSGLKHLTHLQVSPSLIVGDFDLYFIKFCIYLSFICLFLPK